MEHGTLFIHANMSIPGRSVPITPSVIFTLQMTKNKKKCFCQFSARTSNGSPLPKGLVGVIKEGHNDLYAEMKNDNYVDEFHRTVAFDSHSKGKYQFAYFIGDMNLKRWHKIGVSDPFVCADIPLSDADGDKSHEQKDVSMDITGGNDPPVNENVGDTSAANSNEQTVDICNKPDPQNHQKEGEGQQVSTASTIVNPKANQAVFFTLDIEEQNENYCVNFSVKPGALRLFLPSGSIGLLEIGQTTPSNVLTNSSLTTKEFEGHFLLPPNDESTYQLIYEGRGNLIMGISDPFSLRDLQQNLRKSIGMLEEKTNRSTENKAEMQKLVYEKVALQTTNKALLDSIQIVEQSKNEVLEKNVELENELKSQSTLCEQQKEKIDELEKSLKIASQQVNHIRFEVDDKQKALDEALKAKSDLAAEIYLYKQQLKEYGVFEPENTKEGKQATASNYDSFIMFNNGYPDLSPPQKRSQDKKTKDKHQKDPNFVKRAWNYVSGSASEECQENFCCRGSSEDIRLNCHIPTMYL